MNRLNIVESKSNQKIENFKRGISLTEILQFVLNIQNMAGDNKLNHKNHKKIHVMEKPYEKWDMKY